MLPPSLNSISQALHLTQVQRHLFLCATPTKPKCCSPDQGLSTWTYLKERLHALQLDQPTAARPICIYRTKVDCLRICHQGPILLVYPDGIWYHSVTPEVMESILQAHILNNKVVEEYTFAQAPLPPCVMNDDAP